MGSYRELTSRPDFGYVKWVEAKFLGICILGLHYLHIRFPHNFVTIFDMFPQLLFTVVRVFTRHANGLRLRELLLPMLG